MKLTNHDKDTFVRAVMRDVPKVDYEEMFQIAANKLCRESMPPNLAAVWDDKKLNAHIKRDCPCSPNDDDFPKKLYYDERLSCYTVLPVKWVDVPGAVRMQQAHIEQKRKLEALKSKVRGMIQGCSTLAQAKKLLPEFVKYLPDERKPKPQTVNLPMVANVAADLVAMGWPDGGVKK